MSDYFEHGADVGIIGRGESLESAFIDAARSLFSIMVDLEKVKPEESVLIEFVESDPEFALVTWLNQLVGEAATRKMIFSRFELHNQGERWNGKAWGEPCSDQWEYGVEVKGATLTEAKISHQGDQVEVRCVVDV